MGALKRYAPRDDKYVEAKNKLLNIVKNFYKGREKIIKGFNNGVFPLYYDKQYEEQVRIEREVKEQEIEEKKRRWREKKEGKKTR